MRDTLEQRLAARLHDVGDVLPDELDPPADLERCVTRVRNRRRGLARFAALSAAAVVLVAVATIGIVHSSQQNQKVDVQYSLSIADRLPTGTVMLDSRAEFVVAVGADGSQVATLVHAKRGTIVDAQLTSDRRWLWYLSVDPKKKAGSECGEVVRADFIRGTSAIIARAVSFAISPDGTRLALAGAGDLEGGTCVPLTDAAFRARVVVTDLVTKARSTWTDEATPRVYAFNQMRWSNDGRQIVTRICGRSCEPLAAFTVPDELGPALHSRIVDRSGFLGVRPPAAFGPDDRLYVLERNVTKDWVDHVQTLVVYDAQTLQHSTTLLKLDFRWDLKEVVPTEAGIFVVGKPSDASGKDKGPTALYRVEHGDLVHVKDFEFGVLTPVFSSP